MEILNILSKEVKYTIIASNINSLYVRETDCSITYDHLIRKINTSKNLIKDLSSLEIFEIVIRLTKKGLKDFKEYIYPYWNKKKTNIWDIRQLNKTIKYLSNN